MAEQYLIKEETLKSLADAVRKITRTSDELSTSEMKDKLNIPYVEYARILKNEEQEKKII